MTNNLYHPVEHAILAQFFKTKSLHPVEVDDLEKDVGKERDYIGLERDLWGDLDTDFNALDNAVARLVLEGIQDRLPQWGIVDKDFNALLARKISGKKKRKLSMAPQRLLSVNWATSGPGYSWPEDYYLAYVPLYDRYVVTASLDCPDAYGYSDLAIEHFPGGFKNPNSAAGKVIQNWWSEHQNPWGYFDNSLKGTVDRDTAMDWGWKVWGNNEYVEYPTQWLELLNERHNSESENQRLNS